jgi:acetoin utilization deacetylase AcuC-like enzyme
MGGRHHAKREEASGLCFVNDAVLGLLQLVNHFERVLYIDIDVHHGDGTEEAFKYSKQVLTLSCHLHEPGFYPGSGAIDEIGEGKAKYYTINVPFREGIVDAQYTKLFDTVIAEAVAAFKPKAVVMVSGADCLAGDPLGGFSLTLHGVEHCFKTLLSLQLPMLLLGGGGYNLQNVSRMASILTALSLDIQLPEKIPSHSNLFIELSTYYTPDIYRQNKNTEDYLKMLEATVIGNLQHVRQDA